MRRKLFGYIVALFLLIILILTITSFVKPTPQEKVIRECLGNLYNISDYINYNKILEGRNKILENSSNLETPEEANKFLLFDYDKYCTERGINKILSIGLHTFYREVAYNKQFTVELKDITLERFAEHKEQQRIGYNYTVTLKIDYVDTDKVETVYEKGYIYVVKVDKDWKVDSLGIKIFTEVFKE